MAIKSVHSGVYFIKKADDKGRANHLLCEVATQLDQDQYPIVLHASEITLLNNAHVCRFLRGELARPRVLCDLSEEEMTPILRRIDDICQRAFAAYREELKTAIRNDLRIIHSANLKFEQLIDKTNYTTLYTLCGALVFLVGAIPGYYVGSERDRAKDQINEMQQMEILRELSAARRFWLVGVDQSEKKRLQLINAIVQERMITIKTAIEEMAEQEEYDQALQRELDQLRALNAEIESEQGKKHVI